MPMRKTTPSKFRKIVHILYTWLSFIPKKTRCSRSLTCYWAHRHLLAPTCVVGPHLPYPPDMCPSLSFSITSLLSLLSCMDAPTSFPFIISSSLQLWRQAPPLSHLCKVGDSEHKLQRWHDPNPRCYPQGRSDSQCLLLVHQKEANCGVHRMQVGGLAQLNKGGFCLGYTYYDGGYEHYNFIPNSNEEGSFEGLPVVDFLLRNRTFQPSHSQVSSYSFSLTRNGTQPKVLLISRQSRQKPRNLHRRPTEQAKHKTQTRKQKDSTLLSYPDFSKHRNQRVVVPRLPNVCNLLSSLFSLPILESRDHCLIQKVPRKITCK